MLLNFVVRTVNRKLHPSYNQIPFELSVDIEHKPIEAFISDLYKIYDSDTLLMEDDLVLCNNFQEEISFAIEKYPNKIINFFYNPLFYYPVREMDEIIYNQCTFYPKGISKQIADVMSVLPRYMEYPQCKEYSLLERDALRKLGLTVVQYRPCLVQHLDFDTFLVDQTPSMRRTIYFIDYLKTLGIEYSETKNHLRELSILMGRHFVELKKWYYE